MFLKLSIIWLTVINLFLLKVKSRFYVNPMENEKGIHLELKQLNKSASADNFDSEGAVGNQIEDSQYVEEGTVQFEDCDVTQTIGKRANDSQTKQKGKGKVQLKQH